MGYVGGMCSTIMNVLTVDNELDASKWWLNCWLKSGGKILSDQQGDKQKRDMMKKNWTKKKIEPNFENSKSFEIFSSQTFRTKNEIGRALEKRLFE